MLNSISRIFLNMTKNLNNVYSRHEYYSIQKTCFFRSMSIKWEMYMHKSLNIVR